MDGVQVVIVTGSKKSTLQIYVTSVWYRVIMSSLTVFPENCSNRSEQTD